MKFLIAVFIFLAQLPAIAQKLQGEWKYEELIYRGSRIPRPDPSLNLTWTFFSNQTERLYWDRGSHSFCERFARFNYDDGMLSEKVFAVNPDNASDCQKDPDMQIGRQSQSQLDIKSSELQLHLPLGDEEIIYVLKKVEGNNEK